MPNRYIATLVQMTPMIHFQHDDEGATLRASEFKPKFDRFLREHAADRLADGRFLVGKGDAPNGRAFDYRLKILTKVIDSKKPIRTETPDRPIGADFFIPSTEQADEGETDNKKYVMLDDNAKLELHFLSTNSDLIAIIEEWLPSFLAVTNFGFRQNKGFGSFWLDDKSKDDFDCALAKAGAQNDYGWAVSTRNYKGVLSSIGDVYKVMKSGANWPDKYYEKSYLMKTYMHDLGIENEKKAMKLYGLKKIPGVSLPEPPPPEDEPNRAAHIYNNINLDDVSAETPPEQYKYTRALFGLAEHYEFRDVCIHGKNRRVKFEVSDPSKEIERYKSPITFKPVQFPRESKWYVYVFPTAIDPKMFNHAFAFKTNYRNPGWNLSTPEKDAFKASGEEVFTLDDFLTKFFAWGFSSEGKLAAITKKMNDANRNRDDANRNRDDYNRNRYETYVVREKR